MANLIFKKEGWSETGVALLPAIFNNVDMYHHTKFVDFDGNEVRSKHHPDSSKGSGKLHTPLAQAIIRAAICILNQDNQEKNFLGGFATAETGAYLGEWANGLAGDKFLPEDLTPSALSSPETVLVVYNAGKFLAMNTTGNGATTGTSFGKNQGYESLFFAMMCKFQEDTEFEVTFSKFAMNLGDSTVCCANGGNLPQEIEAELQSQLVKLCDNVYYRIEKGLIDVDVSRVSNISATLFASGQLRVNPNGAHGTLLAFNGASKSNKRKIMRASQFNSLFELRNDLTKDEKKLVPVLTDDYIVPAEIETMGNLVKNGEVRNIMMRGPAGSGKTMGSVALAASLGLPYLFVTFNANTEIFDLMGQLIPDTENEKEKKEIEAEFKALPSLMDMSLDPENTYKLLTGSAKENLTDTDVIYAMFQKIASIVGEKGTSYKYIESPFIRAIRNGYLVELQEPTVISNPGVLVGINALMDETKQAVLPTGETIQRHPSSVIVLTTNTEYEGCRAMNQSIGDRCQWVQEMYEPDKIILTKWITAATGLKDNDILNKMFTVHDEIVDKCKSECMTDGNVGARGLISWAKAYLIMNDLVAAAKGTIIPLASADREFQSQLITSMEALM